MRILFLTSAAAAALTMLTPELATAQQPVDTAAYQPRIISAEDARADVALLRRGFETIHPGLYRYASKKEIDAAFAKLEEAASRPITELALHGEIALMLAKIHCDHTKAEMSDALTKYRKTNPTHLPFRFHLIEGRMIVISNDGQPFAPPVGSEILTVNGMTVSNLLIKLGKTVAYDGDTDQAIAVKLGDDSDLMGDDFNEYYPSFFGFPTEWNIGWKRVGSASAKQSTLKPITFENWTKLNAPDGPYRNEFYKAVTWRMAGKVARLKIDTFVNYRNPVQPTAFLGGFFKTMKSEGIEHLILDLRNNGGGSEDVSIALGRYLFDKPFVWSKPVRYKTVRIGDLADQIETWGDREARFNPPLSLFEKTPDGWYERIPVSNAPEDSDDESTVEHQVAGADRFTGRLTVLSGPQNGSGGTRTIAQLKEKAGATIIGEDSSGSAEGPTSGSVFLMTLPKSGLKVRIPEAWNRTNIKSWVPRMGVPVDQLVVPTLADFQAARDRAVEVARTGPAAVADPAELIAQTLAGRWTGTLDYRDYGNDQRTTLPTILESSGSTLNWTFDDGPGKTVLSAETWTFDKSGQSLTIKEGKDAETYRVAELRTSEGGNVLTMVLDGQTTENGKKLIARLILTKSNGQLRFTKMTKQVGEPFLLRHSYELKQ
jgi:Peptidase family S41